MADTNTSNIGLLLPDLGDTFNFALHVENNFSTIDSMMGAVQCTSSTRPSNTYAGQIVYETDSKRYAQNTGTKASPTWTYMSHAALAVTAATRPTSGLSTGETIYETDTTRFLVYNGSSWENKAFSNLSVTSSTHPTSANSFVGEQIYETDTKNTLVWDGTNWRNIQTGPWTTYAVTWGATGNSIGNGHLVGSYCKIGRIVHVNIVLAGGSSTNWGSGGYSFSLPFAANISATLPSGTIAWTGSTVAAQSGGTTFYAFGSMIRAADASNVYGIVNGSASFMGAANPATWTTTATISIDITYECTTPA